MKLPSKNHFRRCAVSFKTHRPLWKRPTIWFVSDKTWPYLQYSHGSSADPTAGGDIANSVKNGTLYIADDNCEWQKHFFCLTETTIYWSEIKEESGAVDEESEDEESDHATLCNHDSVRSGRGLIDATRRSLDSASISSSGLATIPVYCAYLFLQI